VNDTLGHHVGDVLLCEMAERIQFTLADAGTVARFGGDEFSVLVSGLRSPLEATQLAESVLHNLASPFTVEGSGLILKASIGIAPDEFIGLAEHTGLIRQVTDYVLEEAVRQSQSWRAAGIEVPISVNLSAKDLLDAGLPNKVARLLAIYGVPGHALVVEVTETALMSDPDKALAVLDALHELHI